MSAAIKRILWHVILPLVIGFFIYFFFRPGVVFVRWFTDREPLLALDQLNKIEEWLIFSGPDLCWAYSLSSALFIWEGWRGNLLRYFPLLVLAIVVLSELLQGYVLKGFTYDVADMVAVVAGVGLSYLVVRNRRI